MARQSLTLLSRITAQDSETLEQVDNTYPVKVSEFLTRRIAEGNYGQSAARQFVPDQRELISGDGFTVDPVGESTLRPAIAVVQAYENRVAIVATQRCLAYCRYCFRKHFVGHDANSVPPEAQDQAVEYLRDNAHITDVLLTGGDPLAMPNRRLLPFLDQVLSIPHVKTVRVHSRAVSVRPERIDRELVDYLSRDQRFWFYSHMNHPDDINHREVRSAISRLQAAGIPVLNQAVILAGVNDDMSTLKLLMQLCYESRVIPYNLYVLDKVRGATHFFVPNTVIAQLYAGLAELSGPAKPALVRVDGRSVKHHTVSEKYEEILAFLEETE